MCFTVEIFYACRDSCLSRNGKKFTALFNGLRTDLHYIQVCWGLQTGHPSCMGLTPMASYVLRYPLKCWTCQMAWAETMWPKMLDAFAAQVRLRALYGTLESDREIRRRVDRVLAEVKQLVARCNQEVTAKETALDDELQQILRDLHREPCAVEACQERLDRVAEPVDYTRFENERRHIIENSRGGPGS